MRGWTDDEVSFILKFCDSFCITARWSQDCFKVFWVEVLCYQKFLSWMIVQTDIAFDHGFSGQFTWKCVCVSWALLRGLACFAVIYHLFISTSVSGFQMQFEGNMFMWKFSTWARNNGLLKNYIISHKRHPLWKGASCSVFVKILISLPVFLSTSSLRHQTISIDWINLQRWVDGFVTEEFLRKACNLIW